MIAPFFRFGAFNDEVSLIVAFVLGIAFGFFLERAGFGSARKLVAQFYFTDLAVLKVMFTAIITAMVGLYAVSRLGMMDLSLVFLTPTFLVPQMVGGVLLGIGFVIGGYCPGTSVVSAATGRLDAVMYLLGMGAGVFAYAEGHALLGDWPESTSLGELTIAQWTGLPHGLVVLAVVLMAIGAFAAAEFAERSLGGVQHGSDALTAGMLRLNPARVLALVLVAFGVFAAVGGSPYREDRAEPVAQASDSRPVRSIAPTDLATWIIVGRADFDLVDVRSAEDFAAGSIPGARSATPAVLEGLDRATTQKMIVVAQDDAASIAAAQALRQAGCGAVYALAGGFDAWAQEVLAPAKPADDSPELALLHARQASMAQYFRGEADAATPDAMPSSPVLKSPASPQPTTAPVESKPKRKREGC